MASTKSTLLHADIQKKYRDKPDKQQEELMKLQEQGYKPTAGCMPMLVNFLVMFGVIEVVYRPLQRIFHIGADALTAAGEALTTLGISFTTVTRDTNIIAQVIAGESTVTSCFTPDQVSTITEFGQHMDFFGIDLTRVPQYSLAAENLPLLIFPVLAIVTMFISTHISTGGECAARLAGGTAFSPPGGLTAWRRLFGHY